MGKFECSGRVPGCHKSLVTSNTLNLNEKEEKSTSYGIHDPM